MCYFAENRKAPARRPSCKPKRPIMIAMRKPRAGISRTEVLVVVVLLVIVGGLVGPWVLGSRESARQTACKDRMATLISGLIEYEKTQGRLPVAADWDTSALHSLALHESSRWDLFVGRNWAIELLPFIGRESLFETFDADTPICSDENRSLRETSLAEMTCPADEFNRPDNPFVFEPAEGLAYHFARGNFAINGGTQSYFTNEGSTKTPTGDHGHVEIDVDERTFRYWGNGIAGFNTSFGSDDFRNASSSLVALNEIRAGIDTIDIRGCWALGHIAGSVTWGHGINGDAYCPNNNWARSDDIQYGGRLNEKFGPEMLIELGMPCVSYIDKNQNAASRSSHEGGVNTAFLDGSVRFVSEQIDPALWHCLHSRETPPDAFHQDIAELVDWPGSSEEAPAPVPANLEPTADELTNSVGMAFVCIPAGQFTMGIPDIGNNRDTPPETPAHPVKITQSYLLGTTEVTREQFAAVRGELGPFEDPDDEAEPNMPIVDVTWHEAAKFCERLSALPAEKAAGRSYRLPTEAEWEYACRETTSEPYTWRPHRSEADDSGETAGMTPPLPLTAVANYPPNALGLHDMRGNAWEWCGDWFDRDYYGRARLEDPAGPATGYAKVVRGSDWIYVGEGCFINYPILPPWKSSPFVGFRVVCVQAEQDE